MDLHKKLDFVLKMTKHALDSVQHFDQGGTVLSGPSISPGGDNPVASRPVAAPVIIPGGGAGANLNASLNASGSAGNPASGPAGQPLSGGLAGGLGNILGSNSQYRATAVPIQYGTNTAQLNQAYTGAQGALKNTGNIAAATAPGVTQGVTSQGILADELLAETQGQGPNPAQAALNNNTGRNIANAAALAAGTRGAGSNAGLIASNAANTGANLQQEAVGQEAVQEQAQQLNAQQALQNLAGTQVGQASNAAQAANQAQQNEQQILEGANTASNNALVSQQENINTVNADTANKNAQGSGGILGGVGKFLSQIPIIGGLFAEGGEVPEHISMMRELYHPHLARGGAVPMKDGGKVPGQPKVNHDSYSNDIVSAKLSPGEVVIDLNTLHDKGKLGKMARFVAANIERKKTGRAV